MKIAFLTAPNGPTNANKQNGASDPLPMFRLVIYDRATHYILWALTESIASALVQKTDKASGKVSLDRIEFSRTRKTMVLEH
jgi:hypothetical protein